MLQEPYSYVFDIMRFDKVDKAKRKSIIENEKRELKRLKDILAGRVKSDHELYCDPDIKTRIKHLQQIIDIMIIESANLGD